MKKNNKDYIFNKILSYIKLMRVKHYIKNILIFFPLIFSKNLFEKNYFFTSILGFIIFSLLCSIVYIINDIRDKEKDKLHENKKNRPIASGKVSVKEAIILIFIILLIILIGLLYINPNMHMIILLCLYLALNIAYSMGLKNIALIDIIILVSGFLIRVLFGASIIDVPVSNWLYLTVISMAFYLVLGKRRNEIVKSKKNTREVLKYYSKDFLDKNMYMCLTLTIVFYSLWTFNLTNEINNLILTVPIVIIICMRYSMLIENDSHGDPVEVVLNDKILLSLILTYGIAMLGLLYI